MKRRKKGFLFIVKIWERMKMYLSTGLNLFHAFSCYTVFLFFKVIFLSSLRLAASRAGRRRCCCCSSFFFFTFWKTAKIGNPKVQIWKQNQTLSAQLLGKVSQRRDEGDEEIFTTPTPGAAGIGSEHMRVTVCSKRKHMKYHFKNDHTLISNLQYNTHSLLNELDVWKNIFSTQFDFYNRTIKDVLNKFLTLCVSVFSVLILNIFIFTHIMRPKWTHFSLIHSLCSVKVFKICDNLQKGGW